MWSSRGTYTGTGGAVAAGFGGAPFYTLAGARSDVPPLHGGWHRSS